jgi:hypothetical protein
LKVEPSYIVFSREKHKDKKVKRTLNMKDFLLEPLCNFSKYALTQAQYCLPCMLRTLNVCHAVAALGGALLAANCESRLVPWVVVAAMEPMLLENDLLKQPMLWAIDLSHTQEYMENSMKQYAGPASADSALLRPQLSLFASGS